MVSETGKQEQWSVDINEMPNYPVILLLSSGDHQKQVPSQGFSLQNKMIHYHGYKVVFEFSHSLHILRCRWHKHRIHHLWTIR